MQDVPNTQGQGAGAGASNSLNPFAAKTNPKMRSQVVLPSAQPILKAERARNAKNTNKKIAFKADEGSSSGGVHYT